MLTSWRTLSQVRNHDSGSVVDVGVAIRRACFMYNVIASPPVELIPLDAFVCPTGRYMRPFAQDVGQLFKLVCKGPPVDQRQRFSRSL